MAFAPLKRLRLSISLLFFITTAFIFLDCYNTLAPLIARDVLFLQFIPSLVKFFKLGAWAACGWLVVVVLTLICGRVYCSTICPLGTLQDIFGYLAQKRKGRRRYSSRKAQNTLRYTFFALAFIPLFFGSDLLLNLLDPYSNFGRIAANILRPVVLLGNNLTAIGLEQMDSFLLARERLPMLAPVSLVVAAMLLLLVGFLACTRGRLYCNTICPVGTLLGLMAKGSWLRLGFDPKTCNGCKRCESVCKAGCINVAEKLVDTSRCVVCLNCLTVCKNDGLRYFRRLQKPLAPSTPNDPGRREFLLQSGLYVLGLTGPVAEEKKIIQSKPTTIPEQVTSPSVPPGAGSIARFSAICTACHLCISTCPSRVLVPSSLELGLAGFLQPRLNYRAGYCNYECTICTDVCPTGALQPLAVAEKKLTQLGVSKFIKENCVVYTDNTACGACSEHCPTKAVNMVPYANPQGKNLTIPAVKSETCIGCGACEHACPTKPYKAIYVDGNREHKEAQKPIFLKAEMESGKNTDFPF